MEKRVMVLHVPGSKLDDAFDDIVRLTVARRQPLRPEIPVRVNGYAGVMLFDTGNTNAAVILTPKFQQLHEDLQEDAIVQPDGAPWLIGRKFVVRLGGTEFKDVEGQLYEDERGPFDPDKAGNFGCELLTRFSRITIDYSRGELRLDRAK